MVRNIILLISFCLLPQLLSASPAYPKKIKVEASAGKWVSIYLCGDENCKFGRSEDGYTLLSDSIGWVYAEKAEDGKVCASRFRLVPYDEETEELRVFKDDTEKGLQISQDLAKNAIRKAKATTNRTLLSTSVTGERHAIVILMQFKDKQMTFAKDDFDRLFNEIGYSEDNAVGGVRDFYSFASKGKLDYITDIFGPYTTTNNMAYYGANTESSNDKNPLAMAVEAVRSLPEDLDLSVYDADGDGYVDNVHIIYAGYGEEAGASSNAIWAHEYPYVLPPAVNGMRFKSYSCSPELRSNSGQKITRIGVICHELGHALGANDYYDTDYSTGGQYDGTGLWDIMASGSWNDDGISPAGFNPYVRAYDFGWVDVTTLQEAGSYSLSANEVARIETGSDGDYYLLENRPNDSFDNSLPGGGLMIYHHHPNFDNHVSLNDLNSTHPQMFYPVCASSLTKSPKEDKDYGDINQADCEFIAAGKTSFSAETTPSAFAWDGSKVDFTVSSIKKDTDGNILFSLNSPSEENTDNEETNTNIIYKESFESGLKGFENTINSGETNWRVYPSGGFFSDTDIIPSAQDGDKIVILYDGKRGSACNATLSNTQIVLSNDSSYTYSLYYQLFQIDGMTPTLTVKLVSDDTDENISQTFKTATSEWTKAEMEIPSKWTNFHYELKGSFAQGGIFVDNICVERKGLNTAIHEVSSAPEVEIAAGGIVVKSSGKAQTVRVYDFKGNLVTRRSVAPNSHTLIKIPKGIYILSIEGKTMKIAL